MIKILHVDDDPDSREQLKWWLQYSGDQLEVKSTESASEALEELEKGDFSCVVSDYDMPGMDGIELLQAVRASGKSTPFVMLSNFCDARMVEAAREAGANECCAKESAFTEECVLLNSIERAIGDNDDPGEQETLKRKAPQRGAAQHLDVRKS